MSQKPPEAILAYGQSKFACGKMPPDPLDWCSTHATLLKTLIRTYAKPWLGITGIHFGHSKALQLCPIMPGGRILITDSSRWTTVCNPKILDVWMATGLDSSETGHICPSSPLPIQLWLLPTSLVAPGE